MVSVAVSDDHTMFRQGLVQLLSSSADISVVGETENGFQLAEQLSELVPDVCIVDIAMPGPGIPELCESIRRQGLPTRAIALTMIQEVATARQLLASGVKGYVLKDNAFEDLVAAIQAVMAGGTFVSPLIAGKLLADAEDGDAASPLSDREVQVLQLIAKGHTNKKIANTLSLSAKTIETYRARLMDKLEVHSAPELVRKAIHMRIIS